jgi:TPR repeat protein
MDRAVAGLELKRRADAGDAEAMYQYASRINDRAETWKYRCLAANQNHPVAQALVADHYRLGFDSVERDLLRAYVWYRLAELNGYEADQYGQMIKTETGWKSGKKPYTEVLADDMTPSELADGERLVSKWKPNTAECVVAPTSPSG